MDSEVYSQMFCFCLQHRAITRLVLNGHQFKNEPLEAWQCDQEALATTDPHSRSLPSGKFIHGVLVSRRLSYSIKEKFVIGSSGNA